MEMEKKEEGKENPRNSQVPICRRKLFNKIVDLKINNFTI
jgi:hypothetical protein